MDGYLNKYKIIQILFAVAVVLLIANLLVGRFNSEIESVQKVEFDKNFTPAKIDSIFLASLNIYNIKQKWIHKITNKKSKKKSHLLNYKIEVPNDLPNILLIREIYKNLEATKLLIKSKEIKINGNSLLEIYNGKKLVLKSEFNYEKKISHLAGHLNLLIILQDKPGNEVKNELLNSIYKVTFLFLPTTQKIDLVNEIKQNNKDFALIVNQNIEELKFKIKNSFNENRIRQGVKAILESFPKTKFILFTNNFNPSYKIKLAFNLRKVKLLFQKNLINFTEKYKTGFRKIFKSYVMNTGVNDTLNVVLSLENFMKVKNDLKKYEKYGYKFVAY